MATAIGDIDKDGKVDGRSTRIGARVRAFSEFRSLLALNRTEWEKDSVAEGATDDEKRDAEMVVQYIDHLSGQLDELENPPETEKAEKGKPGRPRNPAGPVSKRRYFVVESEGQREVHHVADPQVLFTADSVKVYGPLTTPAGASYRVQHGVDNCTEVLRAAK